MLNWVLAIAVAIPLVGAYKSSVSPRGVAISHITLFSFGAIFYWISPILLGESHILESDRSLQLWYAFFDSHASPSHVVIYLLAITGFYLAFCAGSWLGSRVRLPRSPSDVFPFERRFLILILPIAIAIAGVYAFMLRGQLFAGYAGFATGDAGPRGTFTASIMLLLDLALLDVATRVRASAPAWWRNPYVIVFAFGSVLLLSLGGRLYVVSAILMALVYRTEYVERLTVKMVTVGTIVGLIGAGLTGIVRLGGQLSLKAMVANVASEPLFTSFSLLQFLSRPHFEWWNFPRFLLGDIVNLVPTAILPGKAAYRLNPEAFGYIVYSPLGALNSFFSWSINFGVIGAIVPLFLLGFGLSVLRRQVAPLLRVVYCTLSAWLAFTFFRDPFSVSIVKNMLEFGVLIPIGVAAMLHMLTIAASGTGSPAAAELDPR